MDNILFTPIYYGFIIIICFLIFVTIFISESIKSKSILQNEPKLHKFSTNFSFDEYPSDLNIHNKFDCDVKDLKTCIVGDFTTLYGCRQLAVRCIHFNSDTECHVKGEKFVIPKNKSISEGYALPIIHLADECNPFHGDFILIASNNKATEYMLICQCKHPGFIGNDHVLGNCSGVRVCKGKIDNINKPLREINCLCNDNETSNRNQNDEVPVCRELSISEANQKYTDWTTKVVWENSRTIAKSIFNKTIADNLNVTKLLNPCSNSLIDMSVENKNAFYSEKYKTCAVRGEGIPIKNKLLNPSNFTIKISDLEIKLETIDAVIHTDPYSGLRLTDRVGNLRQKIVVFTKMPVYNKYLNENDKDEKMLYIHLEGSVGFGKFAQLFDDRCSALHLIGASCAPIPFVSDYKCFTNYSYVTRYLKEIGISIPQPVTPPYFWAMNSTLWLKALDVLLRGLIGTEIGLLIEPKYFYSFPKCRGYGILFDLNNKIQAEHLSGILSFADEKDYKLQQAIVN